MSDLIMRDLAEACAAKMADDITAVVVGHIKDHLAATVQAVLRERYAGETVRIYISKQSLSMRKQRREGILARYNGRNVKELAREFGISPRAVFKIVSGRK